VALSLSLSLWRRVHSVLRVFALPSSPLALPPSLQRGACTLSEGRVREDSRRNARRGQGAARYGAPVLCCGGKRPLSVRTPTSGEHAYISACSHSVPPPSGLFLALPLSDRLSLPSCSPTLLAPTLTAATFATLVHSLRLRTPVPPFHTHRSPVHTRSALVSLFLPPFLRYRTLKASRCNTKDLRTSVTGIFNMLLMCTRALNAFG
jgi:hypothetical protein